MSEAGCLFLRHYIINVCRDSLIIKNNFSASVYLHSCVLFISIFPSFFLLWSLSFLQPPPTAYCICLSLILHSHRVEIFLRMTWCLKAKCSYLHTFKMSLIGMVKVFCTLWMLMINILKFSTLDLCVCVYRIFYYLSYFISTFLSNITGTKFSCQRNGKQKYKSGFFRWF